MKERPEISIIIPTLNEAENLLPLLESIKKQTFSRYEVVVADAGSKDATVAIAKQYGCVVVPGGNPAKGRNRGAAAASSDRFLFIDADALLPPNLLEKLLVEVRAKKLNSAGCSFRVQERNFGYALGIWFWNLYFWATQRVFPHASNCIYADRKTHEAIRGFDEDIKFGEDCIYARKAAKVGKFVFLSSVFCYVSLRRVVKEGLFAFLYKYISAEFSMMVLKKNITHQSKFEYTFDDYADKKQ